MLSDESVAGGALNKWIEMLIFVKFGLSEKFRRKRRSTSAEVDSRFRRNRPALRPKFF